MRSQNQKRSKQEKSKGRHAAAASLPEYPVRESLLSIDPKGDLAPLDALRKTEVLEQGDAVLDPFRIPQTCTS